MLQMPGLGSHGKGVCHSSQNVKPGWGDPRECGQTSLQQQSVSLQHSLSGPKPRLNQVKAVNRKGQRGITPIPFLNPDPVAHLVGHANEVPVVIDGHEVTALIDFEAQVLNISAQLCEDLDLEIKPLGQLLELEGKEVQLFLTLDLWRLTSKFWGLEATTRMCCCWPSPPRPILKEFWSWWVQKL